MRVSIITIGLVFCADNVQSLHNPMRLAVRVRGSMPTSSVPIMAAIVSDTQDNNPEMNSPPPLDATTPSGIAALIERSFVAACLELASGHVDALKLFISAALTGYERGFPVPVLALELSNVATQSAGRPLMPEEDELRLTWLSVVYLTREAAQVCDGALNHPNGGEEGLEGGVDHTDSNTPSGAIPEAVRARFQAFVADALDARIGEEGERATSWRPTPMLLEEAQGKMNEVERAVLSHSIRVISLTLMVMDDVARANEGIGGKSVPPPPTARPFIPGTY